MAVLRKSEREASDTRTTGIRRRRAAGFTSSFPELQRFSAITRNRKRRISKSSGEMFVPTVRLDPSQVQDRRRPPRMKAVRGVDDAPPGRRVSEDGSLVATAAERRSIQERMRKAQSRISGVLRAKHRRSGKRR